jgi:hypothetical protein
LLINQNVVLPHPQIQAGKSDSAQIIVIISLVHLSGKKFSDCSARL